MQTGISAGNCIFLNENIAKRESSQEESMMQIIKVKDYSTLSKKAAMLVAAEIVHGTLTPKIT